MNDFIKQYWLQTLFTAFVSGLTIAVKHLFNKIKKDREERDLRFEAETKEQQLIKEGVLAILHDRLYQSCQYHIHRGAITIPDLDNLEYLYRSYHDLDGNGTGTELYNRCKRLPIEPTISQREGTPNEI